MNSHKSNLTIAKEQLEGADRSSSKESAALLTQAAIAHALIEVAEVLSDIREELEKSRRPRKGKEDV